MHGTTPDPVHRRIYHQPSRRANAPLPTRPNPLPQVPRLLPNIQRHLPKRSARAADVGRRAARVQAVHGVAAAGPEAGAAGRPRRLTLHLVGVACVRRRVLRGPARPRLRQHLRRHFGARARRRRRVQPRRDHVQRRRRHLHYRLFEHGSRGWPSSVASSAWKGLMYEDLMKG